MHHTSIEIKARCKELDQVRKILASENARFAGTDHQIDTYFHVQNGRLKLREGNIENYLIFYERPDQAEPKKSDVLLCKPDPDAILKEMLVRGLGVLVEVDKQREIYFIDNVKFHLDEVKLLGSFVEIEALGSDGSITEAKLNEQCRYYMQLLGISDADLVEVSYSDLIISNRATQA